MSDSYIIAHGSSAAKTPWRDVNTQLDLRRQLWTDLIETYKLAKRI